MTVEGEGVLVVDIGVPTDPYIVWQLAKDRSVLSLSLWQDRLQLETLKGRWFTTSRSRCAPGTGAPPHRTAPLLSPVPPPLAAQGLPQFPTDAPSGRRIWLRSGEHRVGRLHRLPDGSLFCDGAPCSSRTSSASMRCISMSLSTTWLPPAAAAARGHIPDPSPARGRSA